MAIIILYDLGTSLGMLVHHLHLCVFSPIAMCDLRHKLKSPETAIAIKNLAM